VSAGSSAALLVMVVLMAFELVTRTSVLVGIGRYWWTFDGPETAQTAHRRPSKDLRCRSRLTESASRRAGFAQPGRGRRVQAERPTGRTAWTRRARSGRLRCAAGGRWPPTGIPERPGPGRVALAAGGYPRVVGPEALPAGGIVVRRDGARGPPRQRLTSGTACDDALIGWSRRRGSSWNLDHHSDMTLHRGAVTKPSRVPATSGDERIKRCHHGVPLEYRSNARSS
jgi:hypothetical protein